ncbi:MAG: DUF308 domain-containing protein [Faecousia sp.]
MKHSSDIRLWLKPVLTCILGLILIFRPGSLTTSIAWAVGVLIALVGAGKLVAFFRDPRKDILRLCGAVILLVLGFSIMRNPVSLERQIGLVIGIVLLLQGIRGFVSPFAAHEKITSGLCCAMGVLLMVLPLTISRLAVILCGVVVLLIGIGMVADLLTGSRSGGAGSPDDIIDAR